MPFLQQKAATVSSKIKNEINESMTDHLVTGFTFLFLYILDYLFYICNVYPVTLHNNTKIYKYSRNKRMHANYINLNLYSKAAKPPGGFCVTYFPT